MSSQEALAALSESNKSQSLSISKCLSSDKQTLTLNNQSFPSNLPCTLSLGSEQKNVTYPLLSIFFQIQDPNISLLDYRKICVDHNVIRVGVIDKKDILDLFSPTSSSTTTSTTTKKEEEEELVGDESQERMTGLLTGSQEDGALDDDDNDNGSSRYNDREDGRDRHRRREDDRRRSSGGGGGGNSSSSSRHKDKSRSRSSRGGDEEDDEYDRKRDKDRHSSSSSSKRHKSSSDRHSKKDREHHKSDRERTSSSSSSKDKRVKEEVSSAKKEKKEKAPMTQDQLVENLDVIVDKRRDKEVENMKNLQDKIDTEDPLTQDDFNQVLDTDEKMLGEYRHAIMTCLSSVGYEANELSEELLEKDRAAVEKITASEIPVGNSASALRCGAAPITPAKPLSNRDARRPPKDGTSSSATTGDFSSVLDIFNSSQLVQKSSGSRRSKKGSNNPSTSTPNPSTNTVKLKKPAGKPIIIIPSGMTSPITLFNAEPFFGKNAYMTRKDVIKHYPDARSRRQVTVKRLLSSKFGGKTLEYEIIDNPTQLFRSKNDWSRVVAVLAQGASWQFKNWKLGESGGSGSGSGSGYRNNVGTTSSSFSSTPVDVFSNAFGFFVGFEGSPIPTEIKTWNVKLGMISKDKRGLDSAICADFWNGLDEWMNVNKREYLFDD